jgi:hypothetical protein
MRNGESKPGANEKGRELHFESVPSRSWITLSRTTKGN